MGVRNIAVAITGDPTSVRGALRVAGAEVDRFAGQVNTANKAMISGWKLAGATVATAGALIVSSLGLAGVAAAQFETRMRNVNSISHLSEAAFRAQGDAVLDLSRRLPQSANTLAEGLYDIASSGFQGSEGLRVLEASAEAASAGLTTTANAAQAITAVLNAYGLSAGNADDVSDALFQTVNVGVVTFEELTGVIGDVVGTAAAAKVDINQLGAAVATMTLSGLSAAESGTSLNRVLQSLLQPSVALAAVYKQLGIESGAAALQQIGLQGVIEQLRTATGGNITTLLELFPEIRAARGVLALMSNDGQNYARVSREIEDRNRVQGATHRALAEQMKATSAILHTYVNAAKAEAIGIGAQVLPAFNDFLRTTRELGADVMPILAAGIDAVTPLFTHLWQIGVDVVSILGQLLTVAAPVAGALAAIAGLAIVNNLTAIARALADLLDKLAANKNLVLALAATVGGIYLVSLIRATYTTVAFNVAVLRSAISMGTASVATVTFAGDMAILGAAVKATLASLVSLTAVATLGLTVALFGAARGFSALKSAQQDARSNTDALATKFDALDSTKAQATIDRLREKVDAGAESSRRYDGTIGQLRAGWSQFAGDGNAGKIAANFQANADALSRFEAQVTNANANLRELAKATGLSNDQLVRLAKSHDIDLTTPFTKSADARREVIALTKDLEKQTGISTKAMANDLGLDVDAMQALGAAVDDFTKKVSSAFTGATDVVANFDPAKAADAATKSSGKLADAEQHLADVRERQAAKTKLTVSDAQALRKAQDDVAEATRAAGKAQSDVANNTLAGYYSTTIAQGEKFADNIQAVLERGLDPSVVSRLLEDGPAKAAPILQRLVSDHTGRLIKITNDGEKALAEINARIVEQARLTAIAVNSPTDAASRDLATAARISAATINSHGKASVDEIAKALHKPSAEILRIAEEFGITIGVAIARGVSKVDTASGVRFGTKQDLITAKGFADGGTVPGTYLGPRSDHVLARLTPREFVMPVASVNYYGTGPLEAMRRRQLPRFADGGMVGSGFSPTATVVRVPLQETNTNLAPVHVAGDLVVADYDDFRSKEDHLRKRAGQRSGRKQP